MTKKRVTTVLLLLSVVLLIGCQLEEDVKLQLRDYGPLVVQDSVSLDGATIYRIRDEFNICYAIVAENSTDLVCYR